MKVPFAASAAAAASLWAFVNAQLAANPTSARGKELTILLILPFAYDDRTADPTSNLYSISTHVTSVEVAAEAAFSELMALRTVLPDFNINLVKINNWNDAITRPPGANLITSGGYSAVQLYEAAMRYPIAGVQGDLFSKTTLFTAALSSYLKLPHCGPTQASKTLNNRKRYPYFYRTTSGRGYGRPFALLMRAWNVQQFAVIQFFDDISVSQAKDAVVEATKFGIKVPYVGKVTAEMYSKRSWGNLFEMIKYHRCSYIFVSGTDSHLRDVYHKAFSVGMVGPDYVWAGFNIPAFMQGYNNSRVQGFITMTYGTRFRNTNETAHRGTPSNYAARSYDCMKSMVLGFNKLSQENPSWSNDSFLDPKNKDMLLPKAYSMTGKMHPVPFSLTTGVHPGYVDLNDALFELDDTGNVLAPAMIQSITLDVLVDPSLASPENAFAITSSDGNQIVFSKMNQPVFYGGGNTPPASSIIVYEQVLGPTSPAMVILRLVQTIQSLLFIAAIVVTLVVVKANHDIYEGSERQGRIAVVEWWGLLAALTGSGPGWWLNEGGVLGWPTGRCREFPIWYAVGVSILQGATGATAMHAHRTLHNSFRYDQRPLDSVVVFWTLLALLPNLALALAYNRYFTPESTPTFVDAKEYVMTCESVDNPQLGVAMRAAFFLFNFGLSVLFAWLIPRGKGARKENVTVLWLLRAYQIASLFVFLLEHLFSVSALKIVLQVTAVAALCTAINLQILHHFATRCGTTSSAPRVHNVVPETDVLVKSMGTWTVRHQGTFGFSTDLRIDLTLHLRGPLCTFVLVPLAPTHPVQARRLNADRAELHVVAHPSGTLALSFLNGSRGRGEAAGGGEAQHHGKTAARAIFGATVGGGDLETKASAMASAEAALEVLGRTAEGVVEGEERRGEAGSMLVRKTSDKWRSGTIGRGAPVARRELRITTSEWSIWLRASSVRQKEEMVEVVRRQLMRHCLGVKVEDRTTDSSVRR
ncbi:hypothetical protein HDU96_001724 [Phlyctochytrium bullatum]|nr:hypothetical protein HDU96_001724 [Phlyctochytrium bullatum]